jgi:hypothetical protein
MTTPTYSISSVSSLGKGFRADQSQEASKIFLIPDTSMNGNSCALVTGTPVNTMSSGDLILVKGPDGALHWYKIDAERSTPSAPVLLYVGP